MRQITARSAGRSAAATTSQSRNPAAHIHSIVHSARKAFGIGLGDGTSCPRRASQTRGRRRLANALLVGRCCTAWHFSHAPVGQAVAQVEPPAPPETPIKTAVENTVIARAWHEDVIKLAIWHSQKGKTQGRQSTRLTGTEVTRDSPRHNDDAERPRCDANDYFAVGTVPPRRIF
jgi:hypothetical protein